MQDAQPPSDTYVFTRIQDGEKVYFKNKHCAELGKRMEAHLANKKVVDVCEEMTDGDVVVSKIETIGNVLKYITEHPSSLKTFPQGLIYHKCREFRESVERNRDIIPTDMRREFMKTINNLELLNGKNSNHSMFDVYLQ